MPDGNGPHDTTDAIAKQTDRDDGQDHGRGAQWQVVEEILGCKNHHASGGVGRRRRSDGAHCVLLQGPRPRVDEADDLDPQGRLSLAALLPPSSLILVSTGETGGPGFAGKVCDEDDKGSRDDNRGWFELQSNIHPY